MKKTLLALAMTAALTAVGANPMMMYQSKHTIGNVPPKHQRVAERHDAAVRQAPLRAEGETNDNLRFCGNVYSWYYLAQKDHLNYRFYIYITPEMATEAAGSSVTSITMSACPDMTTGALNKDLKGTVFVTENLEGEPVTSTAFVLEDCYAKYEKTQNEALAVQTVELDEPYVIKANTGFYFGYTVEDVRFSANVGGDYPLGVDGDLANRFAGFVEVTDKDGQMVVAMDFGSPDLGTNLLLYASTEGDFDGFTNLFDFLGGTLGYYELPVFTPGEDSEIYCLIQNLGKNALTGVDYTIAVNGATPTAGSLDINLAPHTTDYVKLPMADMVDGRNNIEVTLQSINGIVLEDGSIRLKAIRLDGEGYERAYVVEEGTGAWCGYCPAGIAGFEYMNENYPDKFIGIAVHYGDNLDARSYYPLVDKFFTGFPSCIINRDPFFSTSPQADILEKVYEVYWEGLPGAAKIDLTVNNVKEDASRLEATAEVTFAYDDAQADYSLAFVVLENGLIEKQTNYYAGSKYDVGGWEDKGKEVLWAYKDTARDIFDVWGLANSVPASVEKDKACSFDYTLSMANVKKISETEIVCMLLDNESGTVMNAVKVPFEDYQGEAAIDRVYTDASGLFSLVGNTLTVNGAATLYSLDGRATTLSSGSTTLPAGLYIVAVGDKAAKVVVR